MYHEMQEKIVIGKIDIIEASDFELIAKIAKLADRIWREHYIPIIGKGQVDYMIDKFQSQAAIKQQIQGGFIYFLLKESDGGDIGYIGVVVKGTELFLSKLYLLSEKRGKGYGRQAMRFIEQLGKEKGCFNIGLTVNKNNRNTIKVYEKFGFTNKGEMIQDIGSGFIMDDYKMEKNISAPGISS